MDISVALMWFLGGVVFLIAELMLPGFIVIFFAGGCFVTALFAWIFDFNLTVQTSFFLFSSLLLLFSLRKYSLKIFKGKVIDGVDDDYCNSKIGKTAVVTKKITPELAGEIKSMGSYWRATSQEVIEVGQTVIIENQIGENILSFRVKTIQKGG